jgi:hypothetical protein
MGLLLLRLTVGLTLAVASSSCFLRFLVRRSCRPCQILWPDLLDIEFCPALLAWSLALLRVKAVHP